LDLIARSEMSARVYATEITAEGETMRVRVAACILDARIDLEVRGRDAERRHSA
jgi:hypothetical protein